LHTREPVARPDGDETRAGRRMRIPPGSRAVTQPWKSSRLTREHARITFPAAVLCAVTPLSCGTFACDDGSRSEETRMRKWLFACSCGRSSHSSLQRRGPSWRRPRARSGSSEQPRGRQQSSAESYFAVQSLPQLRGTRPAVCGSGGSQPRSADDPPDRRYPRRPPMWQVVITWPMSKRQKQTNALYRATLLSDPGFVLAHDWLRAGTGIRPAIWFNCSIHGDETTGVDAASLSPSAWRCGTTGPRSSGSRASSSS